MDRRDDLRHPFDIGLRIRYIHADSEDRRYATETCLWIETSLIIYIRRVNISLREETDTTLKTTYSSHIGRRDFIDTDTILAESFHLSQEGLVLLFESTDRSVDSSYVVMQKLVSFLIEFQLISFFVIFELTHQNNLLVIVGLQAVSRESSFDITPHRAANNAS